MIVVDTNVVIYLSAQETIYLAIVRKLFAKESKWCAPELIKSEIRNALTKLVRVKMINEKKFADSFDNIDKLSLQLYQMSDKEILPLIISSKCTAYDCEFIALANRLNTKLVTFDKQILREFPKIAVTPEQFLAA